MLCSQSYAAPHSAFAATEDDQNDDLVSIFPLYEAKMITTSAARLAKKLLLSSLSSFNFQLKGMLPNIVH